MNAQDLPHEVEVSLLSEGSKIIGTLEVSGRARIHGQVKGDIIAHRGSALVICATGVIEGQIQGDTIWVDGLVLGEVIAQSQLTISESGRVLGNISTPKLISKFGAFIEGKIKADPSLPASTNPEPLIS